MSSLCKNETRRFALRTLMISMLIFSADNVFAQGFTILDNSYNHDIVGQAIAEGHGLIPQESLAGFIRSHIASGLTEGDVKKLRWNNGSCFYEKKDSIVCSLIYYEDVVSDVLFSRTNRQIWFVSIHLEKLRSKYVARQLEVMGGGGFVH